MGRKQLEVNPECGKRLKQWLEYVGITEKTLCSAINYTQQYISSVINGKKRLTPELAKQIENMPTTFVDPSTGKTIVLNLAIPDRVSKEYLLLESEYMTSWHCIQATNDNQDNRVDLIIKLLELHGYFVRNVTEQMPIQKSESGREYRRVTYAVTSPLSKSERYLGGNELDQFVREIDDGIEMRCMYLFAKILKHDIKSRG